MSDPTKPDPPGGFVPHPGALTPSHAAAKAARAVRQAAELKANLQRRKALTRSRDQSGPETSAATEAGPPANRPDADDP